MFIILISSIAIAYVLALLVVGIYVLARPAGRGGFFESERARFAAVIVLALLSVIPTDLLTAIWLGVVSGYIDVADRLSLLLAGVAPVVAAIVGIQALLLARAYRPQPALRACVFLGLYAAVHALWMRSLFNPIGDIAGHAAIILVVGALTMVVVSRLIWR